MNHAIRSLFTGLLVLLVAACEREQPGPLAPDPPAEPLLTFSAPIDWLTNMLWFGFDESEEPDFYLIALDKQGKPLATTPLEADQLLELIPATAYSESTFSLGIAAIRHDLKRIHIMVFSELPVGQQWHMEGFKETERGIFSVEILNYAPRTAYSLVVNSNAMAVPQLSEFQPSASAEAMKPSPLLLRWYQGEEEHYRYLPSIDFSETNQVDVSISDGIWKRKSIQMPFQNKEVFYFEKQEIAHQPNPRKHETLPFGSSNDNRPISAEGYVDVYYPDGMNVYKLGFSHDNGYYEMAWPALPEKVELPVMAYDIINSQASHFESNLKGAADFQWVRFEGEGGYRTQVDVLLPPGQSIYKLPDMSGSLPSNVEYPPATSFSFMSTNASILDTVEGYAHFVEAIRTNTVWQLMETANTLVIKHYFSGEGERRQQTSVSQENPFYRIHSSKHL